MRISGLATGMDIDNIIKESMKPYQIKIDQTTQRKDVVEIKQKLYRDIIKENRDFFNKHLDIGKSDSLLKQSNWSAVSFSSSDENAVTAKASGEAIKDTYTVSVGQLASKATTTLKDGATGKQTFSFGPDATKLSIPFEASSSDSTTTIGNFNDAIKKERDRLNKSLASETDEKKKKDIQAQLKSLNVTAKYSEISKGIVFEAKDFGQGNFSIQGDQKQADGSIVNNTLDAKDKALQATITNSKNETFLITDKYTNTVTVDGISFNFNDVNSTFKKKTDGTLELDSANKPIVVNEKPVILTGKTDSKELKDKIVAFVNDYNKLIEKLNTTVTTKHDRSYNPLTADQKKDMSENEVKLWNERVEKGQLYKDSDITRIASSMKECMRTFMESSGLNLEKIGIAPVKDYSGNLNGTFTIDEGKLTTALENNTEDVMKLFTATPPTITKDDLKLTEDEFNKLTLEQKLKQLTPDQRMERNKKTGILNKLKDTIDIEFKRSSSSPLLKKAGFEGTSTFSTNELNKNITGYEKKIKDMKVDFSRREQSFYSKFAILEKMMNKLNSQQSNLMSQLGMS